ncbi:hypothetical protein CI238_11648 [Colletotrichum incanum]|uniref:Uncharacterized protein n=1 Tax=Colletotrichum incanum TaxID=1573173 RepID=A0A167BD33_COLIC|nr:hypothetical protein CI238_11648 [Colletotrichum incanum]
MDIDLSSGSAALFSEQDTTESNLDEKDMEIPNDDEFSSMMYNSQGRRMPCRHKAKLRRTQLMAFMEGMAILILAAYILHIQSSTRPILGADPTGFVPEDVAGPLRWTNYVDDMTDPYYVEKDVFDNIEKVQATAARLKAVHNSSVVYINDKHTSYMGDDGNYRPLPPHKTSKGSEMYLIRALHQLHCVASAIRSIGCRQNGPANILRTASTIFEEQ